MTNIESWWAELSRLRRSQERIQARAATTVGTIYWRDQLARLRSGPPLSRPARVDMRLAWGSKRPATMLRRAELNEGGLPPGTEAWPTGRMSCLVVSPPRPGDHHARVTGVY